MGTVIRGRDRDWDWDRGRDRDEDERRGSRRVRRVSSPRYVLILLFCFYFLYFTIPRARDASRALDFFFLYFTISRARAPGYVFLFCFFILFYYLLMNFTVHDV